MPAKTVAVFLAVVLLTNSSCTSAAQQHATPPPAARPLLVTELNGGTVVTDLGYGIQVNKGSSLQRRWFTVNDPSCPMQLSGTGIATTYHSSTVSGEYQYQSVGTATIAEAITAFEVRFLLFDVWGEHMRTLSDTDVADHVGEVPLKGSSWHAWENEVTEVQTVVSFVARVKKQDGTVWDYDPASFLQQLEKIKVKLTEKELSPEKEKPKT